MLASLEQLDLSYNELDTLPEEIAQLARLRVLHLQGNRLRSLPQSFGDWLPCAGRLSTRIS